MVIELVARDRHYYKPDEWQTKFVPMIVSHVNAVMAQVNKTGIRPPLQPVTAASPLVNNPAGVPLALGKNVFRQEDLHIPDSKRRRSTVPATSASPGSSADPASVAPVSQTPITVETPLSHPASTTPSAVSKRASNTSPTGGQVPPAKVQIGPNGPVPVRDRAQEEAVAKRLAKERAEELERQEARKDPLEYAKSKMYKAMGKTKSEQSGIIALPQPPMVQALGDKIRQMEVQPSATNGAASPHAIISEKSAQGQKAQLPSPPWSGTITPRQLAETFANTTDIDFALNSIYPLNDVAPSSDMIDLTVSGDEHTGEHVEELSGMDVLSPLVGESGLDDAYSWTRNLPIPWNGDINSILEPSNNLGVVV
jgi:hypothetical protein